jgi:transposase
MRASASRTGCAPGSNDREVQAHCPNAEVVYDLFHVLARFGRDRVDRVRVDQANALRSAPAQRQVIKRMAYGFRDSAYFFLKIKTAFPGKAR